MRWIPILLLLAGCSPETPQVDVLPPAIEKQLDEIYRDAVMTPTVQSRWARSCALCHVAGEGGAPRMGDEEAWRPRLEKGGARLLYHTTHGFNRMPPLGYCMDCETADFAAMIKMMTGDSP